MKDRIGFLMRSMENGIDSSYDMEGAFESILEEVIDYVIEGMCFDVHRAVHFGYFSVEEYCIRDRKAEVYKEENITIPERGDIFGYVNKHPLTTECPMCKQRKGLRFIRRHMINCKARNNKPIFGNWNINGKRENFENNVEDGSNSDGNDSVDNTPNYESMSPDEIKDFLDMHCGVVSRQTNKPCINKVSCNAHVPEERIEVRRIYFGSFSNDLEDDDIDMDTLD